MNHIGTFNSPRWGKVRAHQAHYGGAAGPCAVVLTGDGGDTEAEARAMAEQFNHPTHAAFLAQRSRPRTPLRRLLTHHRPGERHDNTNT